MNVFGSIASRRTPWVASVILIFGIWFVGDFAAQAQSPPPDAATASPASAGKTAVATVDSEQGESLAEIILGGGTIGLIFYAVLAALSIVAMAVILERLFNLRREKVVPQVFVEGLLQLVRTGQATKDNLESLGQGQTSPLANIIEAGLLRAGRPLHEVEKGVEDAAAWELYTLRARHRPLSVIANVAPLVGLLGTVVGMIIAFRVSSHAGLGKGELLARGIFIALLTTAIGLMSAIPCLLCAAWFNTRIDGFIREINTCLLKTLPCFSQMEISAGSTPAATTSSEVQQPAATTRASP